MSQYKITMEGRDDYKLSTIMVSICKPKPYPAAMLIREVLRLTSKCERNGPLFQISTTLNSMFEYGTIALFCYVFTISTIPK
jgi:hypothetical protein